MRFWASYVIVESRRRAAFASRRCISPRPSARRRRRGVRLAVIGETSRLELRRDIPRGSDCPRGGGPADRGTRYYERRGLRRRDASVTVREPRRYRRASPSRFGGGRCRVPADAARPLWHVCIQQNATSAGALDGLPGAERRGAGPATSRTCTAKARARSGAVRSRCARAGTRGAVGRGRDRGGIRAIAREAEDGVAGPRLVGAPPARRRARRPRGLPRHLYGRRGCGLGARPARARRPARAGARLRAAGLGCARELPAPAGVRRAAEPLEWDSAGSPSSPGCSRRRRSSPTGSKRSSPPRCSRTQSSCCGAAPACCSSPTR